ncbi:MAG: hypothetical protein CR988_02305 [Treponema sp.]|nr:MAG: hypothetical protein CR988_02305 [Treponema sp.]
MNVLTTKEVAEKSETAEITARQWALNNNVESVGSGRGKIYLWTEADLERFKTRNKQRGNFSKAKKNK